MKEKRIIYAASIFTKRIKSNILISGESPDPPIIMKGRSCEMKDLLNIQFFPTEEATTCGIYDNYPLAYAYVPYQKYELPYNKEKALQAGTAFPSLNKPLGVYGNDFRTTEGGRKLW